MTLSAQLTIAFNGTTIQVEAPGPNGTRRKIEGATFDDLPTWLKTELLSQLDEQREKRRKALMTLQAQNVQYVAETLHDPALARRVWGPEWVESRTLRARLAKPNQYDPISGRIVTAKTNPNGTGSKKVRNTALPIDLEFDQ